MHIRYKLIAGRLIVVIVISMLSQIDPVLASPDADVSDGSVGEIIEQIVAGGGQVAGEDLHSKPVIKDFYEGRDFKPVWVRGNGPKSEAYNLIKALHGAKDEGISPRLYRIDKIEELVGQLKERKGKPRHAILADCELLLSDAFFSYAFHLSHGVLDPLTFKLRWSSRESEGQLKEEIEKAVSSNRVRETLADLVPKTRNYEGLRKALAEYGDMATKEEWPKVPTGPKLKAGDKGGRVIAIRNRLKLQLTRDTISKEPADADYFDAELEEAVKKFQEEHGLEPDGVVGFGTVEAMNVSIPKRVCQIAANMDRLRAMRGFFEEPDHILVNVPLFELEAVKNGGPLLRSRVVVGQLAKKTPLLTAQVVHLIFSPKWHVPRSIMVEEKLPLIRKDPAYVRKNNMRLYDRSGMQVDPESIDWSGVTEKNMTYRIVQDTGDFNALGRVKFIFPNPYDVYLHDTPQKSLFQRSVRTLSHGCIRVEKPVELAELLLNDKPEWDREKITEAMNRKGELVVPLTKPLPIHVIYMTAWVDEGGLKLLNDVYGFDRNYEKYVCAE